jgi:hypothetical protein
MIGRNVHARSRDLARLRRLQKAQIHRPGIEPLEGRTMLDSGGLRAAIAIGRTLVSPSTGASSTTAPEYFVHQARNQDVRIAYTDSNQQDDAANRVLLTHTSGPGVTMASASRKADPNDRKLATNLGTSHHEDRAHVPRTAGLADVMPPTASLDAPNVNGSNADSLNPFTFSITYSDDVAVNRMSVWDAGVEVQPPVGRPLNTYPVSVTPSGRANSQGDAPRETATYHLTPPGGSWGTAPAGSYSVILAGPPATDLAGNPVLASTVGCFLVRINIPRLVVFGQPPDLVTVGSPFRLTVALEDGQGSVMTSFDGSLSVALSTNPGGATLGGTLTATTSGGVAVFSGLTLNEPADGYRLQVSGAGLVATTVSVDSPVLEVPTILQALSSRAVGSRSKHSAQRDRSSH